MRIELAGLMVEKQQLTPELRIIQAAIECIERYGLQDATNRRIAEVADVNVAAINYYFRSKQNLMDQVMEITLENAFDWEDLLPLPGDTPQAWCVEILVDLTKGAINYPGLTRAHLQDMLMHGDYESIAAQRLAGFMEQWAVELKNRGLDLEEEALHTAVAEMGYTFISVALAPRFLERSFGLNLVAESSMRRFYTDLVQKVLRNARSV
jgi:TetR/AcrR family transcriptional regulator, regulator of cefoperazone and chloramphenicol sensitivity